MTDKKLDTDAPQRHLDAFLVDNQELEQLNARLSAFNLFNILRIEQVEIRHSNVLAWLLTPSESHGLGPTFLRRFLSRLLMDHDSATVSLSPAQIELMNFSDVEVLREWHNIDILAHSRANGWCLLIENKIHGREGRGQLVKYLEQAKREIPDCQMIPVFLTLEGDDPSDEAAEAGYMSMSHAHVLELAGQIVDQNRSRIPDDARVLLDHYLVILRRLTMQDQELIDLCKAIYRKHREAIDLIVEYGTASKVVDAIEMEIQSQVECEFCKSRGSGVWFLPRQIGELLPDQELAGWNWLPRSVPVVCWCYYRKKINKLSVILEVGPIAEGAKRVRLMKSIQAAGFKFQEAGLRLEAKFTRIASSHQKLKSNEEGDVDTSDESVRHLVANLWGRMWKEGEKILGVLREFDWS